MFHCSALTILSLRTRTPVPYTTQTHCRIPAPSRAIVTLNPDLFIELRPGDDAKLETRFRRDRKPPPGGSEGSEGYDDGLVRVKRLACGVDGSRAGEKYALGLIVEGRSRVD
jgi:hypothetical protein